PCAATSTRTSSTERAARDREGRENRFHFEWSVARRPLHADDLTPRRGPLPLAPTASAERGDRRRRAVGARLVRATSRGGRATERRRATDAGRSVAAIARGEQALRRREAASPAPRRGPADRDRGDAAPVCGSPQLRRLAGAGRDPLRRGD